MLGASELLSPVNPGGILTAELLIHEFQRRLTHLLFSASFRPAKTCAAQKMEAKNEGLAWNLIYQAKTLEHYSVK